MSDIKIPEEIATWMIERGWGEHHDQWHFERRWDYWKTFEQDPSIPEDWKEWIRGKFQEAQTKGWKRAEFQEGEDGNGEDFLFMHRAMIELIIDRFPHHMHYFRGWETPPVDSASELDPVTVTDPEPTQECHPNKKQICADMLAGIAKIENGHSAFSSDDELGRFIETNMRPTKDDPTARSTDPQTGIHNYLHGRWSGMSADLDLGDPRFNLFNTRFWRLHGWIDHQWWRYRRARGANDTDASYQTKLSFYKKMMDISKHHHEFSAIAKSFVATPSKNVFIDLVAEFK